MLQVVRLAEQCTDDDQALEVAIAVLLRPMVTFRSDEQEAGRTVGARITEGIELAIGLGDPRPSSTYPPKQFWEELVEKILDIAPWEPKDDGPPGSEDGTLWSAEEDEAWRRDDEIAEAAALDKATDLLERYAHAASEQAHHEAIAAILADERARIAADLWKGGSRVGLSYATIAEVLQLGTRVYAKQLVERGRRLREH